MESGTTTLYIGAKLANKGNGPSQRNPVRTKANFVLVEIRSDSDESKSPTTAAQNRTKWKQITKEASEERIIVERDQYGEYEQKYLVRARNFHLAIIVRRRPSQTR